MADSTAAGLAVELAEAASGAEQEKIRRRMTDPACEVRGVRMRTLFDLARAHTGMPLAEVDLLLQSDCYEERMAGVSILDFKARRTGITPEERHALYALWMRRIEFFDTWDYIDRAAPRVLGGYLLDQPRTVLFRLARSGSLWHRRTAITAAFWIIRAGDLDDPLALCEILAADQERFVQTSVGVALREVGRVDRARFDEFLGRRGDELSAEARHTARS